MPRFVRLRRRLLHVVAPLSIVVAIAAYGIFLYQAHRSALHGQVTLHTTQLLGSSAHDRKNAKIDPLAGSIEIGRVGERAASAVWDLDPAKIERPHDAAMSRPRIFVAGLGLAFDDRSGLATVSLDGRPLDALRPDVNGKLPPFGALNPPLQPLDVAPEYETLLVFDLPAGDPCAARSCTMRIETHGATWVVRRVGMILESVPSGPPLWPNPVNALPVIGIALGLAALVHLARSFALRVMRPIAAKH
jgi:hypothetical protein